jgi:predicted XRE-type DNA-binding protein
MSQNVFEDMGLVNPELRIFKAQLVLKIRELVNQSCLTQLQVAERASMTQPAVSRMLSGMTKDISVEKLLNVILSLGHSVRILIDEDVTSEAYVTTEFAAASDRAPIAA